MNLTRTRLEELNFSKKRKDKTVYYQKGELILVYRELGLWEYCADGAIETSGGITFSTEEELNKLINDSK